jgi:N6-L-threonylcarbamoyladenine synthase
MHAAYGGVVPELASRDHVHRVLSLTRQVMEQAQVGPGEIDAIAFTRGPGLVGALMVGASMAAGLGYAWRKPTIGVHHLEGHLLSPLLSASCPQFPFVALLCSGGHTQLFEVHALGRYRLLGDTLDDAAGEAFDKCAKLLGLGYPGGPALARLADAPVEQARILSTSTLPRPMLHSGDFDFSFSGLKTAVSRRAAALGPEPANAERQALAFEVQEAITEVLATKALAALQRSGMSRLVICGGVSANRRLRERLDAGVARLGARLFCPELDLCTDNGAMIALAGCMRLVAGAQPDADYAVRPRWPLEEIPEL